MIKEVADEYGIAKYEVSIWMDFEEKYEKGSRIRLNNPPERVLTLR